jgi:hypothetical protein
MPLAYFNLPTKGALKLKKGDIRRGKRRRERGLCFLKKSITYV